MGQSSGRRWFLKSVTALGGAASLPAPASAAEPHAQHRARALSQPYMYLTQPEVAFVEAAVAQQDEVLRGLDGGKIELEGVRSQFFFNMLLANTLEGFFADPIYGGNRDKVGWKLVGFPGVAAVYTAHVDRHGVPYNAVPVSIQDIVDNLARVDEHGHPKHVLLTRKD